MTLRTSPTPLAAACALLAAAPALATHTEPVTVTVTATREARPIAETPASVEALDGDSLREQRPSHPSQILNQLPGVWVSNLSGEGHSTAIRQPLTTGAVYLYLEDGIPTRSTGFFNHNAMYEINVPQAGGLEVSKGPGSALYGSDAIGGMVNVLTRAPGQAPEAEISLEGGDFGWRRLLASASLRWGAAGSDGLRLSLNRTHSDGVAEAAGYERDAANLRWDRRDAAGGQWRTVLAWSQVDQRHVGSVSRSEFLADPRHNPIPFSYRDVDALRLSTTWERETGPWLLSVSPYFRDNRMQIIPSWSVSYDPTSYLTGNRSYGLLAKARRDLPAWRARLIAGIDIDHSPGERAEDSLRLIATTNALGGKDYAINTTVAPVRIYDYDVSYRGLSPYLHAEWAPLPALNVVAGLRYDAMRYDYANHLAAAATQGVPGSFPGGGWYGHAASQSVDYAHWGPKLGATWRLARGVSAFLAYANSFRAPSEGQVFRGSREASAARAQAQALSLLALKPVLVDNLEAGLRVGNGIWQGTLAVFDMKKSDDIVSYQDPVTQLRRTVNAGETSHRGAELGLGVRFSEDWRADLALSHTRHRYEQWVVSGTADYSGKDMESAPRRLAHLALAWTPALFKGGHLRLSWQQVGDYWLDAGNTGKYAGHTLSNLALRWPLAPRWEVFANASNLTDRRYAETAGGTGAAPTYNVGPPRRITAGVQVAW